jgi:uncharacterized protein (TIGR00251 family)
MAQDLPAIQAVEGGLVVGFRVSPGAKKTALGGLYGDRLKVRVAAPPEDNRANRELIRAVAEWLAMPEHRVSIQSGHAGRDKSLYFTGIEEADLRARIGELVKRETQRK